MGYYIARKENPDYIDKDKDSDNYYDYIPSYALKEFLKEKIKYTEISKYIEDGWDVKFNRDFQPKWKCPDPIFTNVLRNPPKLPTFEEVSKYGRVIAQVLTLNSPQYFSDVNDFVFMPYHRDFLDDHKKNTVKSRSLRCKGHFKLHFWIDDYLIVSIQKEKRSLFPQRRTQEELVI